MSAVTKHKGCSFLKGVGWIDEKQSENIPEKFWTDTCQGSEDE
jgi:hypothetical protein